MLARQRNRISVVSRVVPLLDGWAERAQAWATGKAVKGLETAGAEKASEAPRDVFLYVISGDKVRNPAAAGALIERLA
jgi:hypothetical protein